MFRTGRDRIHLEILHSSPALLRPLAPVILHQALGRVLGEVVRGAGEDGVVLLGDETRHEVGARTLLLTTEDLPVTAGHHQTGAPGQPADLHHEVSEGSTGVKSNTEVNLTDLCGNLLDEELQVAPGEGEVSDHDVTQLGLCSSSLQNICGKSSLKSSVV